jgi:hypothetical protein
MQVHFCPEGATVIIHDTPKRSDKSPLKSLSAPRETFY